VAENLGNDFETTLDGGIDGAVTALDVASATGAPAANFRIRVDDELMLVTSKGSGTDWTVERGVEGTTPAAHAGGAVLTHVVTKAGLDQYLREHAKVLKEVGTGDDATVATGEQWNVAHDIRVLGGLTVRGELRVG
jgi:hypothetical protein